MTAIPFQFSQDQRAMAAYLSFSEAAVAETVEVAPALHVDLDNRGDMVGIELLTAGNLSLLLDQTSVFRQSYPSIPEMDPAQLDEIDRFFER